MTALRLFLPLFAVIFLGLNVKAQTLGDVVNAIRTTKNVSSIAKGSKSGSENGAGNISNSGGNYHVQGVSHTKTFNMNGGTLEIEGADNQITVKGFVTKIIIQGAGNTVTADKVNSIKINGADSHVYYRASGNPSGRANTSVSGAGSGASKIR